jgi:hypothetical protein
MYTQSGSTTRLSARVLGTYVSSDLTYESATLYVPLHGIGDNSYKHIKYVDLIVAGSPTVDTRAALEYEKGKFIGDETVSAGTSKLLSSLYPNRWRNLGRGRDFTLRFAFTNDTQIRVYGVEVAWNAGTY